MVFPFSNEVGPFTVTADPLSVNWPAAEMSTVVPASRFLTWIALPLPINTFPVDAEPFKIWTVPLVFAQLAMFTPIASVPKVPGRRPTLKLPSPVSFILTLRPPKYTVVLPPPILISLLPKFPFPILIAPDRSDPLPILSVSADDVLLAMLIEDVASLLPDAMFIMALLTAFPFKKLYVELLTSPLNAFNVEFWTFPENTFVAEPLMSPDPRLNVPPILVPVTIFRLALFTAFGPTVRVPAIKLDPRVNVPPAVGFTVMSEVELVPILIN